MAKHSINLFILVEFPTIRQNIYDYLYKSIVL